MSNEMSAGERNELRRVIRARFKVLRAEVNRREQELVAEVEMAMSERYAAQDAAIGEARKALAAAQAEYQTEHNELQRREAELQSNLESARAAIVALLREKHPELDVDATYGRVKVTDRNRVQRSKAASAAIPGRVADAQLDLDRREATLLERIAVDALESTAARDFIGSIPTVATLVPSARMLELAGLDD